MWEGPRTRRDPLLYTPTWRKVIRPYWQRRRLACQCGCRPPEPIAYDAPTYVFVDGKRRLNGASLVVGHIVSRYEAKQLGWTSSRSTHSATPDRRGRTIACAAALSSVRGCGRVGPRGPQFRFGTSTRPAAGDLAVFASSLSAVSVKTRTPHPGGREPVRRVARLRQQKKRTQGLR
jgi:hypothetical protein